VDIQEGNKGMEIVIKSKLARRILMAVEVVVFLAVVSWIVKSYIAYQLSQKLTAKRLELAIKLDPGNSDYHLRLGRLYQYNILDIQPEKAIMQFRRATELNPYDPQPWLELAAALTLHGKNSEAEACLRQADFVAPNIPAVQWPIANFYLLQGNIDQAFRHFRVVLAGTSTYDQSVFSTAWKASGDPTKILQELIPRHLPTEFSYLYYLLSQKRLDEAQPVWKRIISDPERFKPQQSAGYIDTLISARRPEEAYQVWTDLEKKGLIRYPVKGPEENLVANGDFEDEMVNMGFAWRIAAVEGVYAGLDTTTYHSPGHALLVQFTGKQNLDYWNVYQYVKVSPKSPYRLQAFMKTEDISTDSGPRLEVYDTYDPAALDRLSENLVGTSTGWTQVMLDFATGPKTQLIVVRLRRLPSRKFDNLIKGKVWLDDVQITPLAK
jgi:hypothetical protein